MRMYDIIEDKKRGRTLSKEAIDFVIKGYTDGSIPDYQMSALLMAIYCKGMNSEETAQLTLAMARSGQMMDLSSIEGIKVDKHSTGGVGDKTTIVLGPLVAAAGVKVAKMSGRGLGHTGGTIDKLESIPDFHVELSMEAFVENVNTHGMAVIAQSGEFAPADKKLYALRDVTATVDNVSLIASSIMSKKIAAGAQAIVLDVKCGSGAFMKTAEAATELAETMVAIGNNVGRKTVGIVSDMSQPLGFAVGNALEVIEAFETLKGKGPQDLTELTIHLASNMLYLAKIADTVQTARERVKEVIANGEAILKLKEWIASQGGDPSVVEDYSLLPHSAQTQEVTLEKKGYVSAIDTEKIGKVALLLGAGRETKESTIDLAVGLIIHKKIGDYVAPDDPIATLYHSSASRLQDAVQMLQEAYSLSETEVEKPTLIYKMIY
ncbi:pyrimidine-nucleoside phosphorylase [Sporanaerobium hydrogeniformans]|uniref:Pyrimidine-nucleoside phosphorylase n=1 Tax=Sporanaerobium hydrogeniformans TaxID=3072179 RepID=A0AC61DCY0_9FIRM|nr:pyrimidine-nucleoside phosphorylase [Sporanaerobium hydrogeniformans]PHV71144.1 pyrimidine-nucleoside phosphorylase [Sporanaerobium hydrogeniformans]